MAIVSRFLSSKKFLWILLLVGCLPLFAQEELQVRVLKNQVDAVPGETVSLLIQVTNLMDKENTFQSEIQLPPGWKVITEHQLVNAIPSRQTRLYSIMVMVPHAHPPGRYPVFYKTWNISRPEIRTVSEIAIFIHEAAPRRCVPEVVKVSEPLSAVIQQEVEDDTFLLFPPPNSNLRCGEIFYFSVRVENRGNVGKAETLQLLLPAEWSAIPSQSMTMELPAQGAALKIFGVKTAKQAEAGTFPMTVQLIGDTKREKTFFVNILPEKEFIVDLDNPKPLQAMNMRTTLIYSCLNRGNQPLGIRWEVGSDPVCRADFDRSTIIIPPYQSKKFEIKVDPTEEEDLQFIFVKVYQSDTNEVLYQDTLRLEVNLKEVLEDDPFWRIPTTLTSYFLGERCRRSIALEWEGSGFFDPERDRYLEFYFCSPCGETGAIYNLEETYYLRLQDPSWIATLGDSVYTLTPLTQGYRYGRGAEFICKNERWSCGSHYSQSDLCEKKQLRQMGTFIAYSPCPTEEFSANYLFQSGACPDPSHLISLESNCMLDSGGEFDLELAQNLKDRGRVGKKGAYRVYLRDCFRNRTWYDFETLYAGPDFPGYYENCRFTSFGVNTSLAKRLRFSLAYNTSRQNDYPRFHSGENKFRSIQTQWNGTFNYDFGEGAGMSFNGLFLRAKEGGGGEACDFKQRWAGSSLWMGKQDYWWIASISIGDQRDFLKKRTESPLYRYYFLAGRDLTPNLFVSFSYDGGSVDYYDAGQWKNVFTGSFRYRYGRGCFIELLLQQTKERCKNFALSQGILNFSHTFKNQHELSGSMRYLVERRRSKEYSFLVSYTVPLSTPVGRRRDIGSLTGEVYDVYDDRPVSHAAINLSGNKRETEQDGRFYYFGIPIGQQLIKTEILPFPLIALEARAQKVDIRGGENLKIRIPVVPSCSLKGTVVLFDQKDSFRPEIVEEMVDRGGFEGARILVERQDGGEIYTCLTDHDGRFEFPHLRPGKWKIVIRVNPLPLLHYVENDTFEFEIKPLEEKEITIKILPKIRRMKSLADSSE